MKALAHAEDSTWPKAGEYIITRPEAGGRSAMVACPGCGQLASLSEHAIAADGTVSPSLICPYDGCSFHEWVRLEGWRGCT